MKNLIKQSIYIGCNVGTEENVLNPDDIIFSFGIATGLKDFTYNIQQGYFEGYPERTVVITVISDAIEVTEYQIDNLRKRFQQECILYTVEKIQGDFVYWN